MKRVVDPADWRPQDLLRSNDWVYELNSDEIDEIEEAVARVVSRKLEIIEVRRSDFELTRLASVLRDGLQKLLHGSGIFLLRGLPVHRWDRLQAGLAFWGLGTWLGDAVSQNSKGHLLGHVKAIVGGSLDVAENRAYHVSGALPFHCDSCDVVATFCLRAAKSGGESCVASAVALHNLLLEQRPDLVEECLQPWFRDRRGEVPPGQKPYYQMPIFMFHEEYFIANLQGPPTFRKVERFPELPRLTAKQHEALDVTQALSEELCLETPFLPGDIQFLHNHVVLHSRRPFDDHPESDRKRHLMRLWLTTPGGRPLPEYFLDRYQLGLENGWPKAGVIVEGTKLCAPLEAES